MKNFKKLLSEILDVESETTEDIKPSKENDNFFQLSRTYESKVGDDTITTVIDHSHSSNKAHIKFYVNGAVTKFNPKGTHETLQVYNTVLKHIKHHMENAPNEVKAISYSYIDTPEGNKKNKVYQMLGKKFNVPLEPSKTQ